MAKSKDAGDTKAAAERNRMGLEAARDAFLSVGSAWSGCDGQASFVDGLHSAACAFQELARTLADLGDRFDSGRYQRVASLFREAAVQIHVAQTVDDPSLRVGGDEVAAPFAELAGLFDGLAHSADDVGELAPEGDAETFRHALSPLQEVAAELRYIGSVAMEVRPEMNMVGLVPHFEASMIWMGGLLIEMAGRIVVVAFFSPCSDLCTPCGTAAAPYAFTGRYQVAVVQGGLRRVDPIFSTTACCSESCLLVFSRCNNVTVDIVVAAPNRVALTNRRGVAAAKVMIRNLMRQGRLTPPPFAAGDCP